MDIEKLKKQWLAREAAAKVKGWDFSEIEDSYEEFPLPWDYAEIIKSFLKPSDILLDTDTGGGEFLLSLGHDPRLTFATEGYAPNVAYCREKLLPLGINFKEAADWKNLPFGEASVNIMINRHGDYHPPEVRRLLKPKGVFITQQVGEDNERGLVEMLLPGEKKPYEGWNREQCTAALDQAGFEIIRSEEAFPPIRFYDVGALVWFARIIEWEFPGFSVEKCFERLLEVQRLIDERGFIEDRTHRFLIVVGKK